MLWVVRVAPFVILLVLGAAVVLTRRGRHERTATNTLIAFFVAVSCAVGLMQRDLWPFSAYPVIVESSAEFKNAVWYEVTAVDVAGEHVLDPSPLTRSVFEKWIERRFMHLAPNQQASAARFLLLNSCANDRVLGPLTAPDWLLHARVSRAIHPNIFRVYRKDIAGRVLAYEYRMR